LSDPHTPHKKRYFGTYRNGNVSIPDSIIGLPGCHDNESLASDPNLVLYEAEIDQGLAFRTFRPAYACVCTPWGAAYILAQGFNGIKELFVFDQTCCWVRKEYSARTFFRVHPNRIAINYPQFRFPYAPLGCGSWSSDHIKNHPFDRGAFGFRRVHCGTTEYFLCLWPLSGAVVARQRCPCNGPLWNRMCTDCGGWWCDEWICDIMCCSYRYYGLADGDEVAAAANIALQAYYEGRAMTKDDMDRCLEYWRTELSELYDPKGKARPVCCKGYDMPLCRCLLCYEYVFHQKREIPFKDDEVTNELAEVYARSEYLRRKQITIYKSFIAKQRTSTVCRKCGCRRCHGRKGCCFCTEGCNHMDRKAGEPAPPFDHRDMDDENDASIILRKVMGDPPSNVVYTRWEWSDIEQANVLVTINQVVDQVDEEETAALKLHAM